MTQEKLEQRIRLEIWEWRDQLDRVNPNEWGWAIRMVILSVRAELKKAAEIADRYKEPLIAEEIRKLME